MSAPTRIRDKAIGPRIALDLKLQCLARTSAAGQVDGKTLSQIVQAIG